MPAISIIVPVYNTEKYLHRCIDSILAQTFTDFELILVDDGSRDGSGTICDEYAERDARIRVLHQKNSGVSAARNAALKIASGEYVLFCDSDDFVAANWARSLKKSMTDNPGALVVCDYTSDEKCLSDGEESDCQGAVPKEISFFELYKAGKSAFLWNKIYELKTIQDNQLRFNESLSLSEDADFNARYCAKCRQILFIAYKLYFYRKTENSAARKYRPDLLSLHFVPFSCRLPLIRDEDLEEYCSIWYYHFFHLLDNVFDRRNTKMTIVEKMKYNQSMISSNEFQFCLQHANLRKENKWFVFFMKKKQYWALWLLQKAVSFKNRLRGIKQ